jgi:ActR/RegA family two-component response regulator
MQSVDKLECAACDPGDRLTHERVQRTLEEANGNVTAAARLLNRDRTTLHRFMREHHITVTRQAVVDA